MFEGFSFILLGSRHPLIFHLYLTYISLISNKRMVIEWYPSCKRLVIKSYLNNIKPYLLLESRHFLIRNMITVQIWPDYQPFTCLISLNYHSFIGYKWNTSQIQLKYKGAADSLLGGTDSLLQSTYVHFNFISFYLKSRHDLNN